MGYIFYFRIYESPYETLRAKGGFSSKLRIECLIEQKKPHPCLLLRRQPLHLLGLQKALNPALLLSSPSPDPNPPAQKTRPLQLPWTGGTPARWKSCGVSWPPISVAPGEKTARRWVPSRAQPRPPRARRARGAPTCQRPRRSPAVLLGQVLAARVPAWPYPQWTTSPRTPRLPASSRSGTSWRPGLPWQQRRKPSPA